MRILGAVTMVLLLAGCSLLPSDFPNPFSETQTPVHAATEPPARPAQAFDGECEQIFDLGDLEAVLGGSVSIENPKDPNQLFDLMELNLGGVDCAWKGRDGVVVGYIFPADAIAAAEESTCGYTTVGVHSCVVDTTVNGFRLSGVHFTPLNDTAAALTAVAALEALFATSAQSTTPVAVPAFDETAWPVMTDCSLISMVEFTTSNEAGDPGLDVYVPAPMLELSTASRTAPCALSRTHPDFDLNFTIMGGGRWAETRVRNAEGAQVVEGTGLELVILVPKDDVTMVNVFDGVNWLQAEYTDKHNLIYPTLVKVIAALNAL